MTHSGACSFSVASGNQYKFTGKERDTAGGPSKLRLGGVFIGHRLELGERGSASMPGAICIRRTR